MCRLHAPQLASNQTKQHPHSIAWICYSMDMLLIQPITYKEPQCNQPTNQPAS